MKTIYSMPSLQTCMHFNDCDYNTAKMLRELDLREVNSEILANAAASDARWREQRDADRAAWVAGGGFIGWFKRLMMSVPS